MSELAPVPSDPALAEAVTALRELMLAVQEFRQAIAARLGLTFTDTVAMTYLATEGQMTAGELADRLGLAASSVTALLDRLERADLVVRQRDVDDRRAISVVITLSGSAKLAWGGHWLENALRDLGLAEVPAASKMLSRLAEAMRAQVIGVNTGPLPEESPVADHRR